MIEQVDQEQFRLEPRDAVRQAVHNVHGEQIYQGLIKKLVGDWACDMDRFDSILHQLAGMHDTEKFDLSAFGPDVIPVVVRLALTTAVRLNVAINKAALKRGMTGWSPRGAELLEFILTDICGPGPVVRPPSEADLSSTDPKARGGIYEFLDEAS
ncbi:MAG: hypothetical protein V4719_26480 [Planctomycetota bacterium]